jgi:hypothetical protein
VPQTHEEVFPISATCLRLAWNRARKKAVITDHFVESDISKNQQNIPRFLSIQIQICPETAKTKIKAR